MSAALRGDVLRTAIWGPKPHGFAPKPPASFHYVEMIRASGRLTTLVSTWIASLRTLKRARSLGWGSVGAFWAGFRWEGRGGSLC